MTAPSRFVVLGLALPRSPWFRSVAQWSNAASVPVEFVKCMSANEVRAHLAGGRAFSALLVDGGAPGLDRDFIDLARTTGCAVIVVDDMRLTRDWIGLGASAVVNPLFERDDLVDLLTQRASRIGRSNLVPGDEAAIPAITPAANVAMVCGPGGTGASTAAIALAQGLSDDAKRGRVVLLADFALHAEQAMLHDAQDVMPGIQELVEAHRVLRPPLAELHRFTFDVPERGYQLLLGLRRARNWSTIRPRAFAAAFESVRRGWRVVVCDTDAELEGEAEGGSMDVQERHLLARSVADHADAVFVVGQPTMKGMHGLVRVIGDLLDHSIDAERIVPVINFAPKAGRPRADLAKAVALLLRGHGSADRLASPIFLPERPIDEALRDGVRFPASVTAPLAAGFHAVLDRTSRPEPVLEPQRIVPGSLGSWTDDGLAGPE